MNEIHLDCVDSTNTYAKLHSHKFPRDQITCITAEEQTAGHGRYKRKWVSPRSANLLVTFYFQLPANTMHLTSLAQVMAYSFAHQLIAENLHPKIKWPNDIQLNGRKVSGVLCETTFHKSHVEIFLGIGINVNMDDKTAALIDQPATSLRIETGQVWDRQALLAKLQKQFETDLELFKKHGFEPFHSAFENLLARKGETITVFDGKQNWTGICHSLSNDGQLNLYMPDKSLYTVTSGDIV
jgi:BirA family biotin operon repressor/biotin-[acetyl-CoA-carboxylase] ligase